jgi:hypothetical protein
LSLICRLDELWPGRCGEELFQCYRLTGSAGADAPGTELQQKENVNNQRYIALCSAGSAKSMFARHFGRPQEKIGPEEIRSFQVYLTTEKKLAPGTIAISNAALRFL